MTQILDLRQIQSRSLEPLFQEEIRHWRDELHWDYRPSVELIRKFIDSRALGGYAAMEDGRPAGYGFYVLEDHKGLIGGLYVSSNYAQEAITKKLLTEMVTALHSTPRLARVEAQLMPFGTQLDPIFLRNIVLLPGCGQFLPEASFLVRPATGDRPVGMILTSTVAEGVGHTTQICVMPGHQGNGIGRALMESSIQALRRRDYKSVSLTVTSINSSAVRLYEHLGFRTIKQFAAGFWNAQS